MLRVEVEEVAQRVTELQEPNFFFSVSGGWQGGSSFWGSRKTGGWYVGWWRYVRRFCVGAWNHHKEGGSKVDVS